MVKIVDAFTKMYGRKPTESELAFMMRAKSEREARLNKDLKPKEHGDIDTSRRSQYHAKIAAKNRHKKDGIAAPLRAFATNKLLMWGLSVEEIAEAFDVSTHMVQKDIDRYRLPRADVRRKV